MTHVWEEQEEALDILHATIQEQRDLVRSIGDRCPTMYEEGEQLAAKMVHLSLLAARAACRELLDSTAG